MNIDKLFNSIGARPAIGGWAEYGGKCATCGKFIVICIDYISKDEVKITGGTINEEGIIKCGECGG